MGVKSLNVGLIFKRKLWLLARTCGVEEEGQCGQKRGIDRSGKKQPYLLDSLGKSMSPNTYNSTEMYMSLVCVGFRFLPLPVPPLLSLLPFCLADAWDTQRTSIEELHKTIQTENNVTVTISFIGTLNLGSNICLNYIFAFKSEPPLLAHYLK